MVLQHDNKLCYFIKHPYLFTKQWLMNHEWLNTLEPCCCFQFALCHNDPDYSNYEIPLDQFKQFLECSSAWRFVRNTRFKYNLRSGVVTQDRDPYVYEALKEFDDSYYYDLCNKNKSPKTGRMYFSLLQYIYPAAQRPRAREQYFWNCLRQSMNHVFSQFDQCSPLHWTDAVNVMPQNTSAGFNGLEYSGDSTRRKKGDILPFIKKRYLSNWHKILQDQEVNDYCMLAMRGHLSDRTKIKTRPIWLVSASTIVSELRFYQPFYEQLNTKTFFRDKWITGKDSMPRLNRFLRRHPDLIFYNTDISGWDSYRASWFHEMCLDRLGRCLKMTYADRKEYQYCKDYAIRTKLLLPDGSVFQKLAGIISGTAGTLLINCLLNTIGGHTIMLMMKIYSLDELSFDFISKVRDPNWLGDDFCFFSPFKIDLEKFASLSFKYFCVIINVEKTVVAYKMDDRKYLGYQLKDGFLFREQDELFQSLLYSERPFPKDEPFSISFSRFFSYLLIGGINNDKFLEFFYYYMGKYKDIAEKVEHLYTSGMDNIFKLLKDVWNVKIQNFDIKTFQKMYLGMLKYSLLYGYDLKFSDLITF